MKIILESFRKYLNEGSQEDLNTQIALKIARAGLQDTALGMTDDELKDLVVYIYEQEFDPTGEGWDPYDEDLGQIRDVLTPDDEEDMEEYGYDDAGSYEQIKRRKERERYKEDDPDFYDYGELDEIIKEEVRLFLEKRKKKSKKSKKKLDRCARIAKRKYDVWPSAYASGAAVKCRKGKILKNEK